MPKPFASADLYPKNPSAPFDNPTEEPDYSPDYRMIVPELDTPQSYLPLLPERQEATRIRRYVSLTILTLLFGFLLAATISTALGLIISAVMQQIDLRALGELPDNYSSILRYYFDNSSMQYAVTLIAFLIGNLTAFAVGCRLTGIRAAECFQLRKLRAPALLSYFILGLWIRMTAGYVTELVSRLSAVSKLTTNTVSVTADGSLRRIAMLALYTCIVAPVTEELLMRGLVLKNLCRVSQRLGIMLSALLFAVMHENIPQMIFAFPLGVLLAYITIRHNSVTPAICVHAAVNAVQLLIHLGSTCLPGQTFRTAYMIYTLAIMLLGAIVVSIMLLTERLPVPTPHQSMRGWRYVFCSPLFWIFLLLHFGVLLYNAGLLVLPYPFQL